MNRSNERELAAEQSAFDERDSASYRESLGHEASELAPNQVLRDHVIHARTAEDAKNRANQEIIVTFLQSPILGPFALARFCGYC